jgi:hypothetical protein
MEKSQGRHQWRHRQQILGLNSVGQPGNQVANGKNKHQPVASGETSLLDSKTDSVKGDPMSQYQLSMKMIPCAILTHSGWIEGTFHVPQHHGFIEFLTRSEDYLKLTEVNLPYLKKHIQFFVLRRDEVQAIIPRCQESLLNLPHTTKNPKLHQVTLLLLNGCIVGTMNIEINSRVSDYMMKGHQWIPLHDCLMGVSPAAAINSDSKLPLVLVSSHSITGASEESLSL